jgi:hypothetical protein
LELIYRRARIIELNYNRRLFDNKTKISSSYYGMTAVFREIWDLYVGTEWLVLSCRSILILSKIHQKSLISRHWEEKEEWFFQKKISPHHSAKFMFTLHMFGLISSSRFLK